MMQSLALTIGSMPLSALYLKGGSADAPLLLFLYICIGSAMLAWLSLPYVDWVPTCGP